MKFKITLKDPDALHEAVIEAAENSVRNIDIEYDEKVDLINIRYEKYIKMLSEWFIHNDTIVLEFDVNTSKLRIVPVNE